MNSHKFAKMCINYKIMQNCYKNGEKKKEKEEEFCYLFNFCDFYIPSYFPEREDVTIKCPEDSNQKLPDFFLSELKIAVEIKKVLTIDRLMRVMDKVEKKLKKALDRLIQQNQFLTDTYYLFYPLNLDIIKKWDELQIAQQILEEIHIFQQKGEKEKEFYIPYKKEEEEEKFKFKLKRAVENSKDLPIFWIPASEESHNSADVIHNHLRYGHQDLLKAAEEKFRNFEKRQKEKEQKVLTNILLLINKYRPSSKIIHYFFEGLSYSLRDLLKGFTHIDEIWLQTEDVNYSFSHALLYKRTFFESFEKNNLQALSQEEIELFENWFNPLFKLGEEGENLKEKLLNFLMDVLKDKQPHEIFKGISVQHGMIHLAIDLRKEGRVKDAIWLIEKLKNDPHPEIKEKIKEWGTLHK